MKTFTFRLESDKDAELLKQLLEKANFESKVEGFVESNEDDLSDTEVSMLRQREVE